MPTPEDPQRMALALPETAEAAIAGLAAAYHRGG
jgi:hypothetical protein